MSQVRREMDMSPRRMETTVRDSLVRTPRVTLRETMVTGKVKLVVTIFGRPRLVVGSDVRTQESERGNRVWSIP